MTGSIEDLKPVYLIVSEQELLVDQALSRLKQRVGAVADLDYNMNAFDGETAEADQVVGACNTLPFASERRLVVVHGVEKMSKAGLDALAEYASDPSPTTVLALSGEKLAKNTRLYKAVDKLGGVVERRVPKRNELPGYVRNMFAERGKEISLEAAELFIETVGRDLQQLSLEVDKAVAFAGKEAREITLGDVEQVAAMTSKRTIFEFTDALADRDCRRALRLAARLMADGTASELALHTMAVRTLRDLIAVQSLTERGLTSLYDIAREMGRPDWQIKRLPRQVRAFRPGELVDLLRAAVRSEAEMKTGRDARLVLERWIVKVCG